VHETTPGFEDLQPVEEPEHVGAAAQDDRRLRGLVPTVGGPLRLLRVDLLGGEGDRQVAARRHGRHQPVDDGLRLGVVADEVQQAEQHHRDRPREVERLRRFLDDPAGVTGVGVQVRRCPLGRAGEQRTGVHQHQRVVVDVDDAAPGVDRLRDLVRVVGRRQAGADVEELADPGLGDQVPHGPAQERPVGPGRADDVGQEPAHLLTHGPVGREVVLAAQPVVPDAGGVRYAGVEPADRVGGRGLSGKVRHGRQLTHRRT
jgi:hypothetical protein